MESLNTLVNDLKNIYQDNLLSVFLYGSCIDGLKGEEITSMVILQNLQAEDLKKAYPAIKRWKKTKNPLPVFMDKEEWFGSTDIYPMEYTDIKKRHKILSGENLTGNIEIKKCNLRLQCEYELKNLLIFLRESYLGNSDNNKFIQEIIKKSTQNFMRIFRAVLSLVDEEVSSDDREVITLLSSKTGFDSEVFHKIIRLRGQNKKIAKDEIEQTVQDLINSFNTVLKYVNDLEEICKE